MVLSTDDLFLDAAASGEVARLRYLVEETKANVDAKNDAGWTALMNAVGFRGQLRMVKYLVEDCNASVDLQDPNGLTALMIAASLGRGLIVRYLVETAGVNTELKNSKGETALDVARASHDEWNGFVVHYLEKHMNTRVMHSFLMADASSYGPQPPPLLFSHKLFDANLIGLVWSFMVFKRL